MPLECRDGYPVIPCEEVGPNLIFLIPCPYCGSKHLHGSGGGDGHRAAHCADLPTKRGENVKRPPGAERGYALQVANIRRSD